MENFSPDTNDENNKPKSIIAAEQQINKLEKAIKNNKTEEAIATYITDSLNFLSEVEKSLDDSYLGFRNLYSLNIFH